MMNKRTKVKEGARVAAALATVAGKKVVKRLSEAGDAALLKVSASARKRQRRRTAKAVGKAVLVTGAAAAAVLAGRAIMKRKNGK